MPDQERNPVRIGAVTVAELTSGLVWPVLLRSIGLAVQGPRMLIGLITVLGLIAIANLFLAVAGPLGPVEPPLASAVASGPPPDPAGFTPSAAFGGALVEVAGRTVGAASASFSAHPVLSAILFLLLLPVWAVGGGAICRTVALDVAGDLNLSARDGLLFGLSRVWTTSLALAAPILLLGVLSLVLAAAGAALLGLPVVDLLGSVLYVGFLAVGFLMALVLAGFMAGHALLIPAVAADGCDSIDAVGRAYAYVLSHPGRLLVYGVVLLLQAALALVIAGWIVEQAVAITEWGAGAWIGAEKRGALFHAPAEGAPVASGIIGAWTAVARLLLAAFAVSLYFCSSTALYMVMRRVCDEQDIREVWMEPARPGAG